MEQIELESLAKDASPITLPGPSGVQIEDSSGTDNRVEETWQLEWREKAVIAALMVIGFLNSVEGTAIGPALPMISNAINATSVQAIWIGSSYFLSSIVFQPIIASFSHIFGRKPITVGALLIFIIGTIICSVAQNVAALLAGRTIQGIGCGGNYVMIDILITDLVPLRRRGSYLGFVSLAWTFGSAIGPVMGASFAQRVTWRWIFWIMVPFAAIPMTIILFCLRLQRKELLMANKVREIDYLGMVLFVLSSTSFLSAISWGGIMFPWKSFHTLVPMILGIAGLVAFFVWEAFGSKHPMVPVQIFTSRTAAQGFLGMMTTGMVLWCALYYLPVYYEGVLGYSSIISSVSIFPGTLIVSPAAIVAGVLITTRGKYRIILWTGWAIGVLGTGLMIYLGERTSVPQWIFLTCWVGIGLGILLTTITIAIQASVADEDMALAAAWNIELRTLGNCLGIIIFGTVFSNIVQRELLKSQLFSGQALALSQDSISLIITVSSMADGPQKDELRRAIWLGTRAVWIACVPFLVVSALASLGAQSLNLDRALNTEHKVRTEKTDKINSP